ncbi:MAG: hypothetical protein K1Y02_18020, partial [Candidatus Hydrogenedentes bacterium]|nr:hypothetical protein [Candidatus Hydrogenedentota bacterium]
LPSATNSPIYMEVTKPMNTTTCSSTPKRIGVVAAILGMWLKETNPDLTPDEKIRAKYFCRAKLKEARQRYGRTPPIDVLLAIGEAVALETLAHRETMQTLRRTSPLYAHEEPQSQSGEPGKDGTNKTKTTPTKGRTSEIESLYKTLEQARKARKEADDLIDRAPKESNAKSKFGISPEVLTMTDEGDELMKEVYALGIKRNATYTPPPMPGAPIFIPEADSRDLKDDSPPSG